jgi:hypothetical protein
MDVERRRAINGVLRATVAFVSLLVMPYFVIAARAVIIGSAARDVGVICTIVVAGLSLWSWRFGLVGLVCLAAVLRLAA